MASLAEIRAQNPQYNDLSDQDLADALHRKFYADMPKDEFYRRIGFGAAPPAKTPEQQQAEYLRSQPNLTGEPETTRMLSQGRDSIREVKNDPLRQAHGALGQYVDAGMLGGADEALAGIYALGAMVPGGRSPSGAFQQELARLEQRRREYEAVNKGQAGVATGTGIVLNPLNFVGGEFIAAAPSFGGRALRAGMIGGGAGTVAGGLSTEGDAVDRAIGAGFGGAVGSLLGSVGQPGAELLGFGARKGVEGGRAVYHTLVNQAQARKNPSLQADKLIARALMQDKMTPGQPLPGQGFVNMGGENLTALGRQATVAPGEGRTIAREFFDEQMAGQADRAADALRGLSERGYYGTLESLDATRRRAAGALYQAAYARPAVDVWTPRIAELMERPSMRAAYQRAARIAAEEGRNPTDLGLTFNEAGDPVFLAGARNGQIPSTQTLDYVKRGLDDVMQAQPRDPATGRIITDEATRAIDNTRREFVGILREQNPEYRAALDAWAGPSHSIEIMNLGRDMFKKTGDPADMIRRFRNLPEADREYARVGFMREALNRIGNVSDGGSVYQALFNTQNKRAIMETMFPDRRAFEAFARQMNAERQMVNANRTIMGGSPTSRIDAEKADAAIQGASDVLNWADALKSANPLRILGLALDKGQNLQRGVTPEVAAELARRLFAADPARIQQVKQGLLNVRVPAPLAALPGGWLRNTPLVPLMGQGSGLLGSAIATPTQ